MLVDNCCQGYLLVRVQVSKVELVTRSVYEQRVFDRADGLNLRVSLQCTATWADGAK